MIKVNAFQVAPAEIEAVILQLDGVLDVGVIGLPDRYHISNDDDDDDGRHANNNESKLERGSELIRACVVVRQPSTSLPVKSTDGDRDADGIDEALKKKTARTNAPKGTDDTSKLSSSSSGEVSEDLIRRWVQQRLARYKWLTGGVRFVDKIPKTPSGKMLKKELKEWAKIEWKMSRSKTKSSL